MDKKWRRYAPIGLYLSLVAALVSLGLYIVQREFNIYLQISLGVFIIGLALFAALDPERVRAALTGRQVRYGSNALVMTLAFLGILVVINYLIFENSKRWDLTEDQKNTLAEESLDTLNALPDAVKAVAFFTPERSVEQVRSLLDDYKFYSDGKLNYEFVDPLTDPVAAQEAGITRDGTVVFYMGERKEMVTSVSEREFTSALVRLMSGEDKVVYFLTGHGEYSPEESGDQSYGLAAKTLESKNYVVQILNLLTANAIPADATLIIVAGPLHPLSEEEVSLIENYVDQGGGLIVMEEPLPLTDFGDQPDLLAAYLLETWGVTLGEDIVVDPTSMQPYVAYAYQYADHPITQKMERVTAAFLTARSVKVNQADTNASVEELVYTAPQSWAESDLEGLNAGNNPAPDENVDIIGPVPIAAVVDSVAGKGRIAVFGDVDFATDANFTVYGNSDLLINTVDWVVGQEELINLTPKTTTQRFMLPPQPYLMNLILLLVIFILPGAVLMAGIVVWFQKRRRG